MIGAHSCVDWRAAFDAAEGLLSNAYHVDITKALDPLKDDDFLAIVQSLRNKLTKLTAPIEKQAVRAALAALPINLNALTPVEAARVSHATNLALKDIPAKVMPQIVRTLQSSAAKTAQQTKKSAAKTYQWAINTSLDAKDQRTIDAISKMSTWVLDEYGNRAALIGSKFGQIIEDGVAQGLRNEDIARQLRDTAEAGYGKRSATYWNLVATNASNRSRTYGHLRSMESAGVSAYVFESVLDERTSEQCRALHGTTFPVATGLRAFDELAEDPLGVEKVMPFVQVRNGADGSRELFTSRPGLGTTVIGRQVESAMGRKDARGKFEDMLSPSQMAAAGVMVPPLHHACRSTIIPIESAIGSGPVATPNMGGGETPVVRNPDITPPPPPREISTAADVRTPADLRTYLDSGVAARATPQVPASAGLPPSWTEADLARFMLADPRAPELQELPEVYRRWANLLIEERQATRYTSHDEWYATLHDRERKALRDWTNNDYKIMRADDAAGRSTQALQSVYEALERAPKYEGTVYRGLGGLDAQTLELVSAPGSRVEMNALASFTGDSKSALTFATGEGATTAKTGGFAVWEIESSPRLGAVNITRLSKYPDELEVIVPKGARLVVQSREEIHVEGRLGWLVKLVVE